MNLKPIKVLIVDDSRVVRENLAHIIQKDPRLMVAGYAENGLEALEWLKENSADVITMDLLMPGINGLETTRRIMESNPVPIVIISAAYRPDDAALAIQALNAGALSILEKPAGVGESTYEKKAKEIVDTIKLISEITVVKREFSPPPPKKKLLNHEPPKTVEAVAIGASLGGPPAIKTILSHLPASFPVPIFIVQHIAKGFSEGLIKWLQTETPLHITVGKQEEIAAPGNVYFAPDGCHMGVKKGGRISLDYTPDETGPQPSVGHLFKSMATAYGPHGVGILLTGMGADGAQELLLMKKQGACTIAQDESSSLVFGMPKAAIALQAAQHVLRLEHIAEFIISLVSCKHG